MPSASTRLAAMDTSPSRSATRICSGRWTRSSPRRRAKCSESTRTDVQEPAASILIVDDEVRNLRLIEALLRSEGYRTETSTCGEHALAAVAHSKPDLILLDVMMPGMSGFEVAGKLKLNEDTKSVPIIMEWEIMKSHSALGAKMLEGGDSPYLIMGREIALCHHERWDGTG